MTRKTQSAKSAKAIRDFRPLARIMLMQYANTLGLSPWIKSELLLSTVPGGKGIRCPGYRAPRTGEKRKRRVHLRMDRLPPEVKDVIIEARRVGLTWKETARAASSKAGIHLAASTVQRWYDLRVEQPGNDASRAELQKQIIALLEETLKAVRS